MNGRAFAVLALVCLLGGCRPRSDVPPTAPAGELLRLEQSCQAAMLKSVCSVSNGPRASPAADVIFVAGVGQVDAKAYRELQASGEAMCSTVRQACERDWASSQCKTGRSLWPDAQ